VTTERLAAQTPVGLDTRLLSNLIYQLNIMRRQVSAYPPGHKVISNAAERTLKVLDQLENTEKAITLGIARDRLMLKTATLDPKNPVYREFARALFAHGVVALTIRQGLAAEELSAFARILMQKPGDILATGGIVQAMENAGTHHIVVTPLDYRRFRTVRTENKQAREKDASDAADVPPWESFVASLSCAGEHLSEWTPEALAGHLNSTPPPPSAANADYVQAITAFLRTLDREEISHQLQNAALEKFRIFVTDLHPELRHQFLAGTFAALAVHEEQAGQVLARFPGEMLLDTLAGLDARKQAVPPFVLHLIHQLMRHSNRETTAAFRPAMTAPASDMGKKLELLFAEHPVGDFVPEDYQAVLKKLPAHQPPPTLPMEVIEQLKDSLGETTMENRLCAIVLHLMQKGTGPAARPALKNHLTGLARHFLATGDFAALAQLHRRISAEHRDGDAPSGRQHDALLASFSSLAFAREALGGLTLWGREKWPEIADLVRQVGAPFVPHLLDRLAEEQTRSLRSFYLQLLTDLGSAARQPVIARLEDRRWYLVRNLVILLRRMNEPATMDAICPLLKHPHHRVRQEALKTAFFYRSPHADEALLRELSDADAPSALHAVALARHSRDARVIARLLRILRDGDLSPTGLALQEAVVKTLAAMGNPAALRDLERILFGFSLRHPKRHKHLQRLIAKTLKAYPASATRAIRQRLFQNRRPDLAELRQIVHPRRQSTL
jgi:hypothetical protein